MPIKSEIFVNKSKLIFVSILVALTGCTSSSGIIPDGQSSYRVIHTGDTGFTNSNTLTKDAYAEANAFCAKQGKIVETLNLESKQARPMGGWPEASLWFRCVNRASENSPESAKKLQEI